MSSPSSMNADAAEILDVIIVGAGPCGLATAARLRERRPSALFTDEEHARYTWMSRHATKAAIKNKRTGRVKTGSDCQPCQYGPSILVLDEHGDEFLAKWKSFFRKLEIRNLRSPMFFHPDPSDRDALLAFCHEAGRSHEMEEIVGCVGKEVSKHKKKRRMNQRGSSTKSAVEVDERDRKDYFTPSSSCFEDFCEACISKYRLGNGLVKQGTVQEIEYTTTRGDERPLFHIRTNTAQYLARTVVLALGPGEPIIPSPFIPAQLPASATHVTDATLPKLLSKELLSKIRSGQPTNVLIIGGGLTSAQAVDLCIRRGVGKVYLLMRGHLKVKPFDVDLCWMSKFRNQQQSVFYTSDDYAERFEMIKEARGGGSMTSRASKLLKQYVQDGKAVVHTHTTVKTQNFDDSSQCWTIATEPPIADLPQFDHIFFATGTKTDIKSMPMLQSLLAQHPIKSIAGVPILNEDLAWADGVPLYFTGKLAMLQLGPGAGNLEGARIAAERVSWAIEDVLKTSLDVKVDAEDQRPWDYDEGYVSGIGSKFAGLSVDSE